MLFCTCTTVTISTVEPPIKDLPIKGQPLIKENPFIALVFGTSEKGETSLVSTRDKAGGPKVFFFRRFHCRH